MHPSIPSMAHTLSLRGSIGTLPNMGNLQMKLNSCRCVADNSLKMGQTDDDLKGSVGIQAYRPQ